MKKFFDRLVAGVPVAVAGLAGALATVDDQPLLLQGAHYAADFLLVPAERVAEVRGAHPSHVVAQHFFRAARAGAADALADEGGDHGGFFFGQVGHVCVPFCLG